MMINVTIADNFNRNTVMLDDTTTLRQALEGQGVNYDMGNTTLDGIPVRHNEMDMTFAALGKTEHCSLYSIAKHDNA